MNRSLSLILAVAAVLSCFATAPAAAQVGDPGQSFSAFRLLRSRNIFDPERRGSPRFEGTSRREVSRTSRSQFIALTGTMVTPTKSLAFFAGSPSEFNRVIGLRDRIADFTVTAITAAHVELDQGGKKITVPVGQQLPYSGSASTSSESAAEDASTGDSPGAPSTPSTTPGSQAPAIPPDASEVMRKMMERRQQEMSR